VLWNREILTDRGVTANMAEIVIKDKSKTGNLHTDRRGNTNGQTYYEKGSRKKTKMQESMYRNTTNVEYEMCDDTSTHWKNLSSTKGFKEKYEAI